MDLRETKDLQLNDNSTRHPWELARKRVVQDLLRRHAQLDQSNTKSQVVLDMGSGDTWLVEQLADQWSKHQYLAVDIAFSEVQLQNLRQRLADKPLAVYDHLAPALESLGGREVDVVLLLDVIEHIEDEIDFLRWMQTFPAITAQTTFVITVPAYQRLFCSHDTFLGHYRRYTARMMAQRLGQANLAAKQQGYFFTSLLLPRSIQVLKEQWTKPTELAEGVGNWSGSTTITKWLQNGLWADYQLGQWTQRIGLRLPGLSLYTIAQSL